MILSAKEMAKLEKAKIPGLRLTEKGAVGLEDAAAAAAFVVGGVSDPRIPARLKPQTGLFSKGSPLRPYQREGVSLLVQMLKKYGGAILADDMGLGKTLSVIATINQMTGQEDRLLIVCPAAGRETWREELEKWGFEDDSYVVLGPPSNMSFNRDWDHGKHVRIVVTSYHLVQKAIEECFDDDLPSGLIVDEAHRARGRPNRRRGTNKQVDALMEVAGLVSWVLLVTGTPMFDRPRDLYQLLRLAKLARYSGYEFDMRYCAGRPGEFGGIDNTGLSNEEELRLRLSYFMVRRLTEDVAKELPALTRQIRWIEPTNEGRNAMERFRRGIGDLDTALKATLRGKMDEAISLAHEAKRFLLVTKMRSDARELQKVIDQAGTRCVLVYGEQSHKERAAHIAQARSEGIGIVATLDSISESLNLQGITHTGICHALDWRPLPLAQMEKRIHRINTLDPVHWTYLAMQDSADTYVSEVVIDKLDMWRGVMGAGDKKGLRDTIGDNIDGAGAEKAGKEVMKLIYERMMYGQDDS